MNAAIVTIGDEILIGQIIDTNSAWIAENLNLLGIEVVEKRSVSDKDAAIKKVLADFEGKVGLLVITGGLGPTRDDITKHSINDYFGGKLVENKEVLENIHELFAKRGYVVSELNRLQAMVPDNCIPLKNSSGTAPGMWFERNGTVFVSLPGVPYEMKGLLLEEVIPRLGEKLNGNIIFHRTLMTQGIPESFLAMKIKDWEAALPENVKLAYLPRPGIVRLRLTAIGENKEILKDLLEVEISKLLNIIPEDVFAFEDIDLEEIIGSLLKERSYSLSTAESCTGGRIASLITSVAGSSDYFRGSVIAYSNQAKQEFLGVPQEIIQKSGAVSKEVVEIMVKEAKNKFDTDFSIAVSGIAGPGGGTMQKPVGTTWISVSGPEKTFSREYKFGDHRGRNIEIASLTSLNLLRKMILGYRLE